MKLAQDIYLDGNGYGLVAPIILRECHDDIAKKIHAERQTYRHADLNQNCILIGDNAALHRETNSAWIITANTPIEFAEDRA